MTEQLSLLTPRARHTDPASSKRAAARVSAVSPGLETRILELLGRHGWKLTKNEVCRQLDVAPERWPSVASALSRLKNAGHVEWEDDKEAGMGRWSLRAEIVPVSTGSGLV